MDQRLGLLWWPLVVVVALLSTPASCGWRGELRRVRVQTAITLRYVTTELTLQLRNPDLDSSHVHIALLLPVQAFVSALTIEAGGRNTTTVVRGKRRHTTTTTTTTPRDGAGNRGARSTLRETQRFRASARVGPGESATFYLTYEQLLERVHGAYTCTLYLPPYTVEGGDGVEVSMEVREEEKLRELTVERTGLARRYSQEQERISPSEVHLIFRFNNNNNKNNDSNNSSSSDDSSTTATISTTTINNTNNNNNNKNSAISISYDVDRKADGGEIQVLGKFFVHYLSPEGLEKLPTHTVFALDVSGSMSDDGKLDQLKDALVDILNALTPEDTFEILVFSTRVRSLGVYRGVADEVRQGVDKIRTLQALGGTNFNEALLKALKGANSHNSTITTARQVVFLTDGKPNLGETRPDELRRNVRQANPLHLPVFSLALGNDADIRLLRQVSSDNGGYLRQLDERKGAGEELRRFYREISEPLLTDVDVAYQDEEVDQNSVIRQGPPIFYSGSEVVYSGRLRGEARGIHPVVAGRGRNGPLQLKVTRTHSPSPTFITSPSLHHRDNYVERLWAYLTVQDLLDTQEIVEDRNLRAEMRARAKEIAIRFQFVTKLTSLDVSGGLGSTPPHLDLKSASRHHKSHISQGAGQDIELLSASEFAKTLPAPLSSRISNSRPFSFSDNDPHFVLQAPGMHLPFCFDLHSSPGTTLSLIRDARSGVVVNGLVTAASGRPGATYFTQLFISLAGLNITITPTTVSFVCLDTSGHPTVDSVASSLWPLSSLRRRGRRWQRRGGRAGRSKGGKGGKRGKRGKEGRIRRHHRTHKRQQRKNHRRNTMAVAQTTRSRRSTTSDSLNHAPEVRRQPSWGNHYLQYSQGGSGSSFRGADVQRFNTLSSNVLPSPVLISYAKNSPVQMLPGNIPTRRLPGRFYLPRALLNSTGVPKASGAMGQAEKTAHEARTTSDTAIQGSNSIRRRRFAGNHLLHPQSFTRWIHSRQRTQVSSAGTERNPHRSTSIHPHPLHNIHSLTPRQPVQTLPKTSGSRFSDHDNHPFRNTNSLSPRKPVYNLLRVRGLRKDHNHEQALQNTHSLISGKPVHNLLRTRGSRPKQQELPTVQEHPSTSTPNTPVQRVFHPQARDFERQLSNLQFPTLPQRDRGSREVAGGRLRGDSTDLRPQTTIAEDPTSILSSHQNTIIDAHLSSSIKTTQNEAGEEREEREGEEEETRDREVLKRECKKTLSWRKASGRRYGRVWVSQSNRRTLEVTLGDGEVSLVVTRSKNAHGQHFLGVYLQRHSALSPNTTGIIGQFVYKTVGTVGMNRGGVPGQDGSVRVAVVQPGGPRRQYEVSEVTAFLSSRRSLLHDTHVTCLYIRDQGRGLVAGTPEHYELPCLAC